MSGAIDEQRVADHLASEGRQADDVELCTWIIKHPNAWPHVRAGVEKTLAWLTAAPRRSLTRQLREQYRAVEKALRIGDRKGDHRQPEPPERRGAPLRPRKRAAVAKPKMPFPDWMNDPSLLPKKPPGRVA